MKMYKAPNQGRLATLVACLLAGAASAATSRYVSLSGDGSDGSSWASAFTNVQAALDAAASGDTVHIAGGQTFSLTQQLTMTNSGVSVIGGYEGSGTPGNCDPNQWETIVNRNVAINDTRLLEIRETSDILIEGITFTGGQLINNTSYAGIFLNSTTNTTVRNCVISKSGVHYWPWYTINGGGVGVVNSTAAVFDDCEIIDNICAAYGAGGYLLDSAVTFTNCRINANTAGATDWIGGGGILAQGASTLTMTDCQIIGNSSAGPGSGGVGAWGTSVLKNCLIAYNASTFGSGVNALVGPLTLLNCTIVGNSVNGIGVHNQNGATVAVTNSIVWDNGGGIATWNGTDANYVTANSDLQAGFGTSGTNCFSQNPLFDANGRYGLYLATNSPCVNVGAGTAAAAGLAALTTRTDGTTDAGIVDLGYHFAGGVAFAAMDLYVAPSGSDTAAGTAGDPFKTISHAVAVATGGETIHLAAGSYTAAAGESFPLTWKGRAAALAIVGTNTALTKIDVASASRHAFYLVNARGFDLEGLTVTKAHVGGAREGGAGIYAEKISQLNIRRCAGLL